MNTEEQTLLKDIKTLYEKLLRNIYEERKPGFSYEIHAEQLFQKVLKLYNDFHPEYLSEHDVRDLMHTIDKEVAYVEMDYQLAIKPRATKKLKEKVCADINKANNQIKLDLFRLFEKIKEMNL